MLENLITQTFDRMAQAAVAGIHEWVAPRGLTVVGMSVCASAFTGTPTSLEVDLTDDTVSIKQVSQPTAGTPVSWFSSELGGTTAPLAVAKDSIMGITLSFTGGTAPTATYTITVFCELGQA